MNDSIVSDSMAWAKLADIDRLAAKLGEAEIILENGYAQFAQILLEVQDNRYWQLEHESWGQYIEHVTQKFNLGKAQLYHKLAVVRQLRGVVAADDMTDMGISKASVLADVHRATGNIPDGAVSQARDESITVKDLKEFVAEAAHLPESEEGEWLDLGMAFYVTAEEKATIQDAMTAARQMDPPISNTIKDFQQRKEIILRMAQDFLATYIADTEVGF